MFIIATSSSTKKTARSTYYFLQTLTYNITPTQACINIFYAQGTHVFHCHILIHKETGSQH
jgi:hypothetical protein